MEEPRVNGGNCLYLGFKTAFPVNAGTRSVKLGKTVNLGGADNQVKRKRSQSSDYSLGRRVAKNAPPNTGNILLAKEFDSREGKEPSRHNHLTMFL